MAITLAKETSSQTILLGRFVDETDGKTPETGLTISNTDIKIWKQGANSFVSKNSGGATHIGDGFYVCTLDEIDTDTPGALVIFVHVAGALPVTVECEVVHGRQFDFKYYGDWVHAFVEDIDGGVRSQIAEGVWGAPPDDYAEIENTMGRLILDNLDAPVSSRLAADDYTAPPSAGDVAAAVWDEDITAHTDPDTAGEALANAASGGGGGATAQEIWEYPDRSLTADVNANLVAINGDPTNDNSAELKLKRLTIVNDDAVAPPVTIINDSGAGVSISGDAVGVRIIGQTASIQAQGDFLVGENEALTPTAIADKIWDENVATGHTTEGSAGGQLNKAASIGALRIKKNAALNNFMFLMRKSSDHITPATGLNVTAQRSIDGGAFAACANAVSEVGNGVYKINLDASDLNGDVITLKFTAAGADQRTITIVTQA